MPIGIKYTRHFNATEAADPLAARPNDGSGLWPDASNTGYLNAPGYPGSLTAGSSTFTANTTYQFKDYSGGAFIGSTSNRPANVTFYGCRFTGVNPDQALVAVFGPGVTFQYCTFQPNNSTPSYVTWANSYQYGVIYDGAGYNTGTGSLLAEYCDFWGFGNAFQVNGSTQANPHVFRHNWFHHAADQAGQSYHHDGILCTVGGANERYVTIEHNTFATLGNTNGVALQRDGLGYYDHITVTSNYFAGWGLAVCVGNDGGGNSNIVVTDNVYSTEITSIFGPLYGWGGTNNTWRRNRFQVRAGDPSNPIGLTTGANGQYWWPTDHAGHATDYIGG